MPPRARGVEETIPGRLCKALDVVTVRAGPELASTVVGELTKGDVVRASTCVGQDGRFQVLLQDGRSSGWVSAITRKHKITLFEEAGEDDTSSAEGWTAFLPTAQTTPAVETSMPQEVREETESPPQLLCQDEMWEQPAAMEDVEEPLEQGAETLGTTGASQTPVPADEGGLPPLMPDGFIRPSGLPRAVTGKLPPIPDADELFQQSLRESAARMSPL